MSVQQLKNDLGKIDIYLLDQILKERFLPDQQILDAGCGSGRNLFWFAQNGFQALYGIDKKESCIQDLKRNPLLDADHFAVAAMDNLPFSESYFDGIICNAVLHFAESEVHFFEMINELWRILKKDGLLFVRMTSIFGLEGLANGIGNGVYKIPDGTNRFLLTEELLTKWEQQFSFEWVEPFKTVNVNNVRSMSTLVMRKR